MKCRKKRAEAREAGGNRFYRAFEAMWKNLDFIQKEIYSHWG